MRALILVLLVPALACAQAVPLDGKASGKGDAGEKKAQKVVQLSGTAHAVGSGGSK